MKTTLRHYTKKKLKYIRVKKNGEIYLATDIFGKDSKVSIYNDYTIMNKLILNYYNISFAFNDLYNYACNNFTNPGINEVDYKNIFNVLKNTVKYIEQSNSTKYSELSVFDTNKVKLFIPKIVDNFICEYSNLINEVITYNSKKEKKRNLTKF